VLKHKTKNHYIQQCKKAKTKQEIKVFWCVTTNDMLHTHFVVPRSKQGDLQPSQTILLSLCHPKQNFVGNVNPSPASEERQFKE